MNKPLKQFRGENFGIGLIPVLTISLVLLGCEGGGKGRESSYKITNTGISDGSGGCWVDDTKFAVLQGNQPPGSQEFIVNGLYYLDVQKPHDLNRIDLSPIDSDLQKRIRKIECQDGSILLSIPGSEVGITKWYSVRIDQPPKLISEMRGGQVHLSGRYVLGNKLAIREGVWEDLHDCDVRYLVAEFQEYCWPARFERRWPLSNGVITEYRWEETTQVRDPQGRVRTIPNTEKPLIDQNGKQIVSTLHLRDFNRQIIADLLTGKNSGANYGAFSLHLIISPDERYAYTACRKLSLPHNGADRVCRYLLDGKQHEWEEVFAVDEGHLDFLSVESLSMSHAGDLFFIVRSLGKHRGIWRYSSDNHSITEITHPPIPLTDENPITSPNGTALTFIRPHEGQNKIFLAIKGT